MPKMHYSTDTSNRLLVGKDESTYPMEGEFKIERNILTFTPERKSKLAEQLGLPKKLKFVGHWQLDENYDLKLTLIETKDQIRADELKLHSKIIAVQADELTLQAHFKKGVNFDVISLLSLQGKWQANEFNQLEFLVARDADEDKLTFAGAWELNQNQKLIYKYTKQDLVLKTKSEEELTFKGFWQIDTENRLAYILDLNNRSFFEFRVQLESPVLWGKEGEIRYRLGIGVKELRKERIISLFGQWKIGRRQDIFFVIDYGQDNPSHISFGAQVSLTQDNQFAFALKNRKGQDLDLTVIFTHDFLQKDAQVFARVSELKNDRRLEAGVKIKW